MRFLRLYTSPERRGQHRVLIAAIASMTGIARQVLYRYRDGELGINERVQAVLSPLMLDIESGKTRFRRVGQEWRVEYVEPPLRPPPPQPRIVRADAYDPWAHCASCDCPRFSSFVGLAGKQWACDGCVSEPDRIMLGARPR